MSSSSLPASEWEDLQALLTSLTGVFETPPEKVVTGSYTNGALLGNGDIGVSVGGGHGTLALYIGKSDFWTDDAPLNTDAYRFRGVRPITVGAVVIRVGRTPNSSFHMEQDILNAEVRTDLSVDRNVIHMRTWVAATENLIITDLWTEGDTSLPITVETWTPSPDAFPAKRWETLHEHNGLYTSHAGVEHPVVHVTRETHAGIDVRWVCRAAIATRLVGIDVHTASDERHRVFQYGVVYPGQTLRIVSAVSGGKNETEVASQAVSVVASCDETYLESLHTAQLDWWSRFWQRSCIRVYDEVLERFYYGAFYSLACCSRAGKVAPGLMGNWLTTDSPMCHGDFHLNYNFQAPYYGVYTANRLELAEPYYEAILDYLPEGRRRAREEIEMATPLRFPKGVRGVLYPVGIGPWGSTPDESYHNQVSDATFAAIPFIWHYEYTRDQAFLRDKTYPLMLELADFWEDYLQKDDKGRYVVFAASYEGYQDLNPSQDLGFIRLLLNRLLAYSDLLERDQHRHARWHEILDHLSEEPTTTYQGTTVYNHAETDAFLVGFTTDNLEFIHPGDGLHLGSSSEQLQIARDTIRLIDAWKQGNNAPKIYVQAARVGYPVEDLIREFKALLTENFRNNLTLFQGGGGVETVGATEMIHSLLLQSQEGIIRLFPLWFPDKPASFRGLRAVGAFLVSASYRNRAVEWVEIHSETGGLCRIVNPWPPGSVRIRNRSAATDATEQYTEVDGQITFATKSGETYQLSQI